ncbi:unnamed protein product [Schistocephalus solidus]|uniref:UBX domain-containing protein n=1 Tax=Schistocephalus solidus TaxID=70667 RepID=A0A183S8H5_SCHSO|nr:unnamed protein product [Schistocephalus solidus]
MGGAAMGSVTGSPNFSMASPDRGGMARDNTTAMAGLQQLLIAAAAGGMSQEQIASAALALGLGRDVTGGGPRFSGMADSINSGDRYAGRGVNGSSKGGPPAHHDPYPRRPPRGDYNGQQQSMPSNSASDVGSHRGFSRHRLGTSGGSRPAPRHHMTGDQRSDSSRMYMKRVALCNAGCVTLHIRVFPPEFPLSKYAAIVAAAFEDRFLIPFLSHSPLTPFASGRVQLVEVPFEFCVLFLHLHAFLHASYVYIFYSLSSLMFLLPVLCRHEFCCSFTVPRVFSRVRDD